MEQDLTDYEHLGDPDAEHVLERRDQRRQQSLVEIAEAAKRAAAKMPPFKPEQIAKLRAIFQATAQQSETELMRWRLRLYCGHVVEQTAHRSHKTIHQAFTGSSRCPECSLSPAMIIAAKPLGTAGTAPVATSTPRTEDRPRRRTRKELEARIVELEAENEALRRESGG
ncbi:hypothetical protein GCM10029978_045440 [Actinoallomurus acanthiterrae]